MTPSSPTPFARAMTLFETRLTCRLGGLDRQRELYGIGGRREAVAALVAHAQARLEIAHADHHRLGLDLGQVRAVRVELLVARHQLGPLPAERLHEVLASARAQ